MALSLVDVGTTANDGTGDPLRTAFQTVNTALTAVNNAIVVGTGTTTFKDDSGSLGVTILANGNVGVNTTPQGILSVLAGARVVTIGDSGTVNTPVLKSRNAGDTGYTFMRYDAFEHQFFAQGVEAATVESNGDFTWLNAGATVGATWDASALSNAGAMGFGTIEPTAQVDLSGNTIRVRTAKTPASAAATGNAGDICWDASYIYVCTATNTWKRAAISTW